MNYQLIDKLIKEKDLTRSGFAIKMGWSPTGFSQMINNRTMKVETLEFIAKYFNVPVSYFFDELIPCDINQVAEPSVEYVKPCSLCKEKDKTIMVMEKYIDDLEEQLGKKKAVG